MKKGPARFEHYISQLDELIVEAGPTNKVFEDPDDPRTLDYVRGRFG